MKKILFIVAIIATMIVGLQAQGPARVPAYRGIIERVQPNGDTLRTYLRGDEHWHFAMTEDGWHGRIAESPVTALPLTIQLFWHWVSSKIGK